MSPFKGASSTPPAECIKFEVGLEVGLSPDDFVLHGDPVPSPKGGLSLLDPTECGVCVPRYNTGFYKLKSLLK